MKSRYIFVYGTLLREINHPKGEILQKYSKFLSRGYIYAKLYNIGSYPAAILDSSKKFKTYGELYKIEPYFENMLFEVLDEYEGYLSSFKPPYEYLREVVEVYLANSDTISNGVLKAQTYIYNYEINNSNQIISGDYLQFINQTLK